MKDPHNINYINQLFEENKFPIRCFWDEEKGRVIRTTRAIAAGEVICSSKPLHIVQETPGNPVFEKIRRLGLENRLIYEPIWYWCALNSLTEIGNFLSTISAEKQRQMLTLYTPEISRASEAVLEICGEEISDPLKVEKLLQVWKYNCFEFSEQPLGFSLYFLPSFLSHACSPNAIWAIEDSDRFVLRARKQIAQQQEISISYLPEEHLARPSHERRKILLNTKNFTCNCQRCSEEISDHPETHRRLRKNLDKIEASEVEEISDQTISEVQDLPDDHWLKEAFAGEISRRLVTQKKYKLAFPWKHFRVLALRRALGAELVNAAYAWALEELADVQYVLGNLEDAGSNFQQSLEILQTLFGPENEYTLTYLDLLVASEISFTILARLNFTSEPVFRRLPYDSSLRNFPRPVTDAIFVQVPVQPLANVRVVAVSDSALALIGLSPEDAKTEDFALVFSGSAKNFQTLSAHNYVGFQFGAFSGQLGDGAACLLGCTTSGWEVGLKGSGLTPFSRFADGRKVLRSSIREFLASEHMHALGIPSTRASSVIVCDDKVVRDVNYNGNPKPENCAVVTRLSRSFFRFGSLELGKAADPTTGRAGPLVNQHGIMRDLAELIKKEYFAEKQTIDAMVLEISERTGRLVASWDAVGFTHGVMNTDNMSIVGETIDYGPYGFVEYYQPDFVPNTSDRTGRYALSEQRNIGAWNCGKLADALDELELLDAVSNESAQDAFHSAYDVRYRKLMRGKLALKDAVNDLQVDKIIAQLLELMELSYADYTRTFRTLSADFVDLDATASAILEHVATEAIKDRMDFIPVPEQYLAILERQGMEPQAVRQWHRRVHRRSNRKSQAELKSLWLSFLQSYLTFRDPHKVGGMKELNPNFVLRNYHMQRAIVRAESGDFDAVRSLLAVQPFSDHIDSDLLKPQPQQEACTSLSCSS